MNGRRARRRPMLAHVGAGLMSSHPQLMRVLRIAPRTVCIADTISTTLLAQMPTRQLASAWIAIAALSEDERRSFLEVCDDRYGRRSIVLTSQLPFNSYPAQIGDPTIADSILDRMVHKVHGRSAGRGDIDDQDGLVQTVNKPGLFSPLSEQ